VPLTGIEALTCVTAIETRAGLTVRFVCVLMLPELALISAVPGATLVTKPEPLTVMMVESEEVQVTELVRFELLPSEYVPVAVSCSVFPTTTDESAGVIASEASVRGEVLDPPLPHPAMLKSKLIATKNASVRRI
jgi:hypothetical protein